MTTEKSPTKRTSENRIVQTESTMAQEKTDEERTLIQLQNETKTLEDEIRKARKRIAEIRSIIQGSKDVVGLAATVDIQKRRQAWIDDEPRRAALRATPEFQKWRKQFLERRAKEIAALPKGQYHD